MSMFGKQFSQKQLIFVTVIPEERTGKLPYIPCATFMLVFWQRARCGDFCSWHSNSNASRRWSYEWPL